MTSIYSGITADTKDPKPVTEKTIVPYVPDKAFPQPQYSESHPEVTPVNLAAYDASYSTSDVPKDATGFTEGVKTAFRETAYNQTPPTNLGPLNVQFSSVDKDQFIDQIKRLQQIQAQATSQPNSDPNIEALTPALNHLLGVDPISHDGIWQQQTPLIEQLQKAYPAFGLKTYDQIKQDLNGQHAKIEADYQNSLANSSVSGKIGSFIGAVGGFFNSSANAVSTILPLGLGAKAATTIGTFAKVGAAEAAVNGALAGLSEPNTIANRELVGLQTSDSQIVTDIGTQALIGGVIGGGIGAVGKMFSPITRATVESVDALDKAVANGAKVSPEAINAAKALRDTAEMAMTAPPEINQALHLQAMQKAVDDLNAGNPVDVSSILGAGQELSNEELNTVARSYVNSRNAQQLRDLKSQHAMLSEQTAEAVPSLQVPIVKSPAEQASQYSATIQSMRDRVAVEDLTIPVSRLAEDGTVVEEQTSVKKLLQTYDNDKSAFERLHGCLVKGGEVE